MLQGLWHLLGCRDDIEAERKKFSKLPATERLEGGDRQTLTSKVHRWREAFDRCQFQHGSRQAIKVANGIHRYTNGDAVRELAELNNELRDDFSERHVVVIPEDRVKYYDASFDDARMATDFPEATKEIKEAGSCLAAGRHMASVFHLMRGVEQGMRAVAVATGGTTTPPKVPLEYQVWQTVIEGIESRTKRAPEGWSEPSKSNGRAFFSGTVADLFAFKDETRNLCMHTRHGFHDYPGALSVRNRVDGFFKRLIGKVQENGSRSLIDPSLFL
jgi:hypothetical protein